MMHIVKHKADPISAMIRSKDGKTIAMSTMTTTTSIRTMPVENRWKIPCSPFWSSEFIRGRSPSPHSTSTVATRGRQLYAVSNAMSLARRMTHFKGTLVIGIIAMNTMMQRERARGY